MTWSAFLSLFLSFFLFLELGKPCGTSDCFLAMKSDPRRFSIFWLSRPTAIVLFHWSQMLVEFVSLVTILLCRAGQVGYCFFSFDEIFRTLATTCCDDDWFFVSLSVCLSLSPPTPPPPSLSLSLSHPIYLSLNVLRVVFLSSIQIYEHTANSVKWTLFQTVDWIKPRILCKHFIRQCFFLP